MPPAPVNPAQLRAYVEAQMPRALEQLERLVRLNRFSGNPEGGNAVGALTAALFEPLGFEAERVGCAQPGRGDHWVLRRAGQGGPQVGLVSHLDTVFPPGGGATPRIWLATSGRPHLRPKHCG